MRQLMLLRFALFLGLVLAAFTTSWALATPADKSYDAAMLYVKIQNDQRAIDELLHFTTSFQTDPRLPQVTFLLGYSYQRLLKYDKAIPVYLQAIDRASGDASLEIRANAYFQLAECYRSLQPKDKDDKDKDYEKAASAYGNFLTLADKISLTDKNPMAQQNWANMILQAHYWRADSLGQTGNIGAAQDEYSAVIRIAPQDKLAAWANYALGILKENQGQYADAVTVLAKFNAEYKTSEVAGEASFALGLAYLGEGRDEKDPDAKKRAYGLAVDTLKAVLANATVTAATQLQAVLALAQAHYALGEKNEAEAAYARALTMMPQADSREALDTHLQHGHILYNLTRYTEANIDYTIVANNAKFPDLSVEGWYWLGNSSYQLASVKKDQAMYQNAVTALLHFLSPPGDKDERAGKAALLLAYCYEDLANFGVKDARDKALTAFKDILAKWDGTDQAVQARAGIARLSRSMTPEDLRKLVDTLPAGVIGDVTLQLAYTEFTAGHASQALDAAQKVLAAKPAPTGDVKAQANYLAGAASQQLGHPADALPYFRQVIAGTTGDLAIFAWRASVQADLDLFHYADALTAVQQLMTMPTIAKDEAGIAAEKSQRLMYLAAAYNGVQNPKDALATYQQLVANYPKSALAPYALMNSAWIAQSQKDMASAIERYQQVIRDYLTSVSVPEAHFQLGYIYSQTDQAKYKEAIDEFSQIPETDKLADQAVYNIAQAEVKLLHPDDAMKEFLLLTTKYPKSPLLGATWYQLGDLKLAQKDYAGAAQYFTQASALSTDRTKAADITYKLAVSAYLAARQPDTAAPEKLYAIAADAFGRVVVGFPEYKYAADSCYWQADALSKLGPDHITEARAAYTLYLKNDIVGDFAVDAAVGLVRTSMAAKQYPAARIDIQQALAIADKVEKAANDLLLTMKEPEAQKTLNSKLTRVKILEAECQYSLGQSYLAEKSYTLALTEFVATAVYRRYGDWYKKSLLQSALCFALQGDMDSAASTLKELKNNLLSTDTDLKKQADDLVAQYKLKE